jgi:6-methylsalicylate decarboxylase
MIPDYYLAAMKAAGVHDVEGWQLPAWSAPAHLAIMDRNAISTSLLSISAPGVSFVQGQAARELARRVNEGSAELVAKYPGRFGAFAILTLPDIDGALREMEYALDVLKLDGVGLLTNVQGTYLGDPKFDALFAEADRREAVVYTHPVAPLHFEDISLGFSGSTIEYPFDTTRMILKLAASGTLRRYTKMKLIASHGGGTVPYLAERMSNLISFFDRAVPKVSPQEVITQLKSVYYDATAVANDVSLGAYTRFVPSERRLYGSDTPFMPEVTIATSLAALRGPTGLHGQELDALQSGNALRLFPRLAAILNK